MSWRIPLADVRITGAQRSAVLEVLDSGWLSMGPRTEQWEADFAAAADVPHAVAVSSGTAALLIALQALGVGPGDEVVLPSLTFVADANVVVALGAVPVLADVVSPVLPLSTAHELLARVTPRTKAVLVVHYAGHVVDVQPLLDAGLRVVEDAAHASGALDDTGWLPLRGDVACFSFFANKNLALGEGGMATTADPDLAARLRLLRSHGMTSGTWDRHRGHASDYDVVATGWNLRTTELAAAMGSAVLPDLSPGNARRRELLTGYRASFDGTAVRMAFEQDDRTAAHLAVAVLPPGTRPAVRAALAEQRVQSSFHYPPVHGFTAFEGVVGTPLPQTDAAAARLVTLPLHPHLSDAELRVVVDGVLAALR
ncbi:MAG: DegT/DnrJ/EryC1/StrS family aminotransferase [Pseudorhodobacter sp.]|nr:DegT/DnrJ/EryC1/StrS family aminotransferase [Frankiaceae bacterium]